MFTISCALKILKELGIQSNEICLYPDACLNEVGVVTDSITIGLKVSAIKEVSRRIKKEITAYTLDPMSGYVLHDNICFKTSNDFKIAFTDVLKEYGASPIFVIPPAHHMFNGVEVINQLRYKLLVLEKENKELIKRKMFKRWVYKDKIIVTSHVDYSILKIVLVTKDGLEIVYK